MSLTEQVLRTINALFPQSDGKRTIATQFLQLDHLPSQKEVKEIVKPASLSEATGYSVLKKLREIGLMTEAEGSIPLYEARLRAEMRGENPSSLVNPSKTVAIGIGEKDPPPNEHTLSPQGESDQSPQARRKFRTVAELDAEMTQVSKTVQDMSEALNSTIKEIKQIAGLKGQTSLPKDDPPDDHASPTMQLELVGPENIPKPKKQLIIDADEDEVKHLTREELVDVALGRRELTRGAPSERSPQLEDAEQTAIDETLRKIIVFATPYTMLAFDKARDGGFGGTFSDFVNASVEKVYTDRGYALVWTKVDPISKTLMPPNMGRRGPMN